MTKFHINKDGIPAPCKAKTGNCPLGNESQHFTTEKEAQVYVDNQSAEKYGVLPEIKNDNDLSNEWKNKFLEHKSFDTFVREHARDIVSEGIFDRNANLHEESLNKWKDLHYENSLSKLREQNPEESADIVRDNIGSSEMHGWFREYNSDYKPRLENILITNPEVRNASLNIAHKNYQDNTGESISYEEFLNKEIEVYRGGNFDMIKNDVFVSYSFDKGIAEKFASETKGSNVKSLKIKMKDTLGSLQTTGESEIMIRRKDTEF